MGENHQPNPPQVVINISKSSFTFIFSPPNSITQISNLTYLFFLTVLTSTGEYVMKLQVWKDAKALLYYNVKKITSPSFSDYIQNIFPQIMCSRYYIWI